MALDFLLLYEHVTREYESVLLLQAELARRGYSAEIHQLLDRKKLKYFTCKKPRVLVASCLYDDEGLNSHVYNNAGVLQRVVNLHWEQMLSDTQEEEAWFNFNGRAKECVQTCWGEETRRRLIAHGVSPQNAPVTGALMMDFLRPEFRGYFADKAEVCRKYGLDAQKRLLLYISSFGYASMGPQEVAELSAMAGTDFSEFARVNRESMDATLAWFDEYLPAHPGDELVYRRHPTEWDSRALRALEKKHANFHVIFEDSVRQWIVASDRIFIWMSSAVAEVYFARKGCAVLRPQPIPHQFDPVIYRDAACVCTYGAFAAAAEAEDAPFPIAASAIRAYFDEGEKPAYQRMADLLEDVYKNPPRGAPFGGGFTPRFNKLKCLALAGVQLLLALRLDPRRLGKNAPGPVCLAGRVYGYVQKARVPKGKRAEMRARIARFVR